MHRPSRPVGDELRACGEVGRRDLHRAQRREHAQVDRALQVFDVVDEPLLHEQRDGLNVMASAVRGGRLSLHA